MGGNGGGAKGSGERWDHQGALGGSMGSLWDFWAPYGVFGLPMGFWGVSVGFGGVSMGL